MVRFWGVMRTSSRLQSNSTARRFAVNWRRDHPLCEMAAEGQAMKRDENPRRIVPVLPLEAPFALPRTDGHPKCPQVS